MVSQPPANVSRSEAWDMLRVAMLAGSERVVRYEATPAAPTVLPSQHADASCCQALEIATRL